MFGFLKTAFGFFACAFAFAHSILFFELYLHRRFCLALPLFLVVLRILWVVRNRTKGQQDLPLAVGAVLSALIFSVAVCDFTGDFAGNTIVLMVGALLYAGPLVFFFLHLRTALFLIYHKAG